MKNAILSGTNMKKQHFIGRFVAENRNTIVEIIASLFILLFAYTGINKFIAIDTLKGTLKEYPIIGDMPVLIAWGLPVIELLVSVLLFIPRTKLLGLYSAMALMISFTLYLGYMLVFTPKLPCTCGGMLQQLSWTQHLIFNLLFIVLSVCGLLLYKSKPSAEN